MCCLGLLFGSGFEGAAQLTGEDYEPNWLVSLWLPYTTAPSKSGFAVRWGSLGSTNVGTGGWKQRWLSSKPRMVTHVLKRGRQSTFIGVPKITRGGWPPLQPTIQRESLRMSL